MRCLTFQSKAPGRAGRPDQVVQALEVVRPLEFKPGEAVIGDHRPHGEGRLELGDVHVAVGGGQRSQAAWERREKRGKVSLRHLCTPRRQTQHSWPVRKEHTLLLPTYLPLLSAMRIFDFIVANGTGGSELGGREGRCS